MRAMIPTFPADTMDAPSKVERGRSTSRIFPRRRVRRVGGDTDDRATRLRRTTQCLSRRADLECLIIDQAFVGGNLPPEPIEGRTSGLILHQRSPSLLRLAPDWVEPHDAWRRRDAPMRTVSACTRSCPCASGPERRRPWHSLPVSTEGARQTRPPTPI